MVAPEPSLQEKVILGENHIGKYQFSSKMGTVDKFINSMGYEDDFSNLEIGTDAFDARWQELAQDDSFGQAQHDYIQTVYYNKQSLFLKNYGYDLTSKGPAVQDMIWSTSVQFGPDTWLIIRALRDSWIVPEDCNDEEIIKVVQDYKIKYNNQLFRSSNEAVRQGTLQRAKDEKNILIALARKTS